MDTTVLERIRGGISERRSRLADWLQGAPAEQRAQALGPMTESALHSHLAQLDLALEKSDRGDLGICEVCHEPVNAELLEVEISSISTGSRTGGPGWWWRTWPGTGRPGAGELSYANAGHNPPALARPDSELGPRLEWLMPTGPALGLTEEADYAERQVRFRPGDMLTLYTDGIPEAFSPSGEQFGQARLEQLLRQAMALPAPEVVRSVRDALQAFAGEEAPSDDITLIVFNRTDR